MAGQVKLSTGFPRRLWVAGVVLASLGPDGSPPAALAAGGTTPMAFEAVVSGSINQWFEGRPSAPPRQDSALARAARGNSARAAGGALPHPADLRFELRRASCPDADVLPFVSVAATPEAAALAVEDFLERESRSLKTMTHLGVGAHTERSADGKRRTAVTVILVRRMVTLDSVPDEVPLNDDLRVSGSIARGFAHPRLLFTAPDGLVHETPLLVATAHAAEGQVGSPSALMATPTRFEATVPLRGRAGEYRVEVLVDGARGPTVAALFSVHAGTTAPRFPVHKVYPTPTEPETESLAQARALALINEARARHHLSPLRAHAELHSAARAHAEDMLERGWFGHISPRGEGPLDRVAKTGVVVARVLENVSIAPNVTRAHADLMDSPGHRANILDPTMTHIGIGVVRGVDAARGVVYVSQAFARLAE